MRQSVACTPTEAFAMANTTILNRVAAFDVCRPINFGGDYQPLDDLQVASCDALCSQKLAPIPLSEYAWQPHPCCGTVAGLGESIFPSKLGIPGSTYFLENKY